MNKPVTVYLVERVCGTDFGQMYAYDSKGEQIAYQGWNEVAYPHGITREDAIESVKNTAQTLYPLAEIDWQWDSGDYVDYLHKESKDMPNFPIIPFTPTEPQFRTAQRIAGAFGHQWACWYGSLTVCELCGGIQYPGYEDQPCDQEEAPSILHKWATIPVLSAPTNAEVLAWVEEHVHPRVSPGISTFTGENGIITESTGTNRFSWEVYSDGHAAIKVNRPHGVVISFDMDADGNALNVQGDVYFHEYHLDDLSHHLGRSWSKCVVNMDWLLEQARSLPTYLEDGETDPSKVAHDARIRGLWERLGVYLDARDFSELLNASKGEKGLTKSRLSDAELRDLEAMCPLEQVALLTHSVHTAHIGGDEQEDDYHSRVKLIAQFAHHAKDVKSSGPWRVTNKEVTYGETRTFQLLGGWTRPEKQYQVDITFPSTAALLRWAKGEALKERL